MYLAYVIFGTCMAFGQLVDALSAARMTVGPGGGAGPGFNPAALMELLGKNIDDRSVRDFFVLLNQGTAPVAHVSGDAHVGESHTYFFPANGVIVCSTNYSGRVQRIGLVTLVGRARRVYLDGREYALAAFRGPLPFSLKWEQARADILERLGGPVMSNEGINLSDRPKTPMHETRDADEFMQGRVIVRLIYTDSGCLEEIDLQGTSGG
jgi:hypothetical protein